MPLMSSLKVLRDARVLSFRICCNENGAACLKAQYLQVETVTEANNCKCRR